MRVRVIPYQQYSNSAKLLSRAIGAKRLKLEGSKFKEREEDVIINWGNSKPLTSFVTLNNPANVKLSCNKIRALHRLENRGISVVPWTTLKEVAQTWCLEGSQVYARELLTSHSGKGITLFKTPEEAPEAPLYTKAISGKRREFRIHVFKDQIIHCQTKKRRNGWRDNPNYCDEVRNRHTGWIYSLDTEHITPPLLSLAVNAVRALGLDFGGVDIIKQDGNLYVLEVNTAVGLNNPSTLEAYTKYIKEYISNI